jgi:hypothetical protein
MFDGFKVLDSIIYPNWSNWCSIKPWTTKSGLFLDLDTKDSLSFVNDYPKSGFQATSGVSIAGIFTNEWLIFGQKK